MEEYKPTNIYVVECVDKNEINTMGAKALYDDVISRIRYTNPKTETEYFSIETKKDFFNTMDNILGKEIQDKVVLIHIYIHGNEENGLQTNDLEFISWKELMDISRKINIKTNNNLILVLANCFGSYIGRETFDKNQKVPFNTIISSRHKEEIGNIYDFFEYFYNNLCNGANIFYAIRLLNGEKGFYPKHIATMEKNSIIDNILDKIVLFYKKGNKEYKYEEYEKIIKDLLEFYSYILFKNFLFERDRTIKQEIIDFFQKEDSIRNLISNKL